MGKDMRGAPDNISSSDIFRRRRTDNNSPNKGHNERKYAPFLKKYIGQLIPSEFYSQFKEWHLPFSNPYMRVHLKTYIL